VTDSVAGKPGVASDISEMLSRLGSGPVFVHSDPFAAARLVPRSRDRIALIESHLQLLTAASEGRAMWMPAFNYDFPRTRTFDVAGDPSQLGPIPETFRMTRAEWRTEIPIFSVAGTGAAPAVTWSQNADPFGPESIFAKLLEADGVILYYGNTFHYNTIVHFAERQPGGPPYRYDKLFRGTVTRRDNSQVEGSLNYHVRPMGTGLDYDWRGILSRALDAGACVKHAAHPEVLASSARGLNGFLVGEMRKDPLALLDAKTRSWVEPKLKQLGRRFQLGDFENAS